MISIKQRIATSIGTRIMTFTVFLSVIAILATGVIITINYLSLQKKSITQRNFQIAELAAGQTSLYLENARNELRAIAEVLATFDRNVIYQELILQNLAMKLENYRRLSITDRNSKIILSSSLEEIPWNLDGKKLDQAWNGEIVFSPVKLTPAKLPVVTIALPIKILGENRKLLVADLNIHALWVLIDGFTTGDMGIAALVSDEGRLIAHRDKGRVLTTVDETLFSQADNIPEEGVIEYRKVPGEGEYQVVYKPVEGIDWTVLILQPMKEARMPMRIALIEDIILMALGVGLAVYGGRKLALSVSRPLKHFVTSARRIGEGDLDSRVPVETDDEIGKLAVDFNEMVARLKERDSDLRLSQENLRNTLREKELLLKELHHRVKNNLQIVSSLLSLRQQTVENRPEISEILIESKQRINAMAQVHEQLYSSEDFARVKLRDYVSGLVWNLLYFLGGRRRKITFNYNVEEIDLPIDIAVTYGLILNELLTSSIEHVLPRGEEGEIEVIIKKEDEKNIVLICRDNRKEEPDKAGYTDRESFSLFIIDSLVDQLKGRQEYKRDGGFECRIIFPIPKERRI